MYLVICLLINADWLLLEGQKRLTYYQLKEKFSRLIRQIVNQSPKQKDQLGGKFNRLIRQILNQSPKQKDSLEACKALCIELRASDNANVSLFSPEKVLEINSCSDFRQFFEIVGQHFNWDEPSILTEIIKECGLEETEKKFNEYKKEMATFRTLEIVSSNKSDPPPGFERFHVVIDKPYIKLTLDKYEDIKTFIFNTLDVHRYVTSKYIRILLDPLHLEWHVTTQAVPLMIKMAYEQREVFKRKFFIFMEIGKEVIINTNTEQISVSFIMKIMYALTF